MALNKTQFADHLREQTIISLAKKQKIETSEVKFEATQQVRDALIYVFPIHGNYSLKLVNPRSSLKSNFYVKESGGNVVDYFSGGSGGFNHFSNILTTKFDETGKCLFEHVADNDNVTPVALEVLQEVFEFTDEEIAQIRADTQTVCDRVYDMDLSSAPFKKPKSQNNHNVAQTIVKHGDDSIIITPIHSLKRHVELYNVLFRDTGVYPVTSKFINATLKEWKKSPPDDLQSALSTLQSEIIAELSKLPYSFSEHEVVLDSVGICFAKCLGHLNKPKTVHKLLSELSSEINSKYKIFGSILEQFEISNQNQNVCTQLPKHKYTVKVRSRMPNLHAVQQYRKEQKLAAFFASQDYSDYPISTDSGLQNTLERLFTLREIASSRSLHNHEEIIVGKIARSCRKQIDHAINQAESYLADYAAENDIKTKYKRPSVTEVLPLLYVSNAEDRAFLKTKKCSQLIEKELLT